MPVISAETLYTTNNNYKICVYGKFVVSGSTSVGRNNYIKCDEIGYSAFHKQPAMFFSSGTYYWDWCFSVINRNVTYELRFEANTISGAWLPGNLICPILFQYPIDIISLSSVKLSGQFTHDERKYFASCFQYKQGETGIIKETTNIFQYWPIGVNYLETILTLLLPNVWYYWRFYPKFSGINDCVLPWVKFFTGNELYEYRAFGMDFEGVVKYGEWKQYNRPFI